MFENVLVGYDGTARSDDALVLASLIASGSGGHITAVCVYWYLPTGGGAGASYAGPDMRPGDLEEAVTRIAEHYDSAIEVKSVANPSSPRALQELTEGHEFDLVIVGSTGRGKVGRTLPGTTADRLLHGSPCPVAVAPVGYRDRAPERLMRIGAAYCREPDAQPALEVAAELAQETGAELAVVSAFDGAAIERIRYGALGVGEVIVDAREAASTDLADAVRVLGHSISIHAHLIDGSAVDVLTEQAADLDLLVLGSRGYGPVGRVLLGSVTHRLMLQSTAPLLVVPRTAGLARHLREGGHSLATA